jgi:hypothetical protein
METITNQLINKMYQNKKIMAITPLQNHNGFNLLLSDDTHVKVSVAEANRILKENVKFGNVEFVKMGVEETIRVEDTNSWLILI